MSRAGAIALLATALLSCNAEAAFNDGNTMLGRCTSNRDSEVFYCLGAIAGLADGIQTVSNGVICLPPAATVAQLRDVLLRHLANHPESRHHGIGALMYVALFAAFPCPR